MLDYCVPETTRGLGCISDSGLSPLLQQLSQSVSQLPTAWNLEDQHPLAYLSSDPLSPQRASPFPLEGIGVIAQHHPSKTQNTRLPSILAGFPSSLACFPARVSPANSPRSSDTLPDHCLLSPCRRKLARRYSRINLG